MDTEALIHMYHEFPWIRLVQITYTGWKSKSNLIWDKISLFHASKRPAEC